MTNKMPFQPTKGLARMSDWSYWAGADFWSTMGCLIMGI